MRRELAEQAAAALVASVAGLQGQLSETAAAAAARQASDAAALHAATEQLRACQDDLLVQQRRAESAADAAAAAALQAASVAAAGPRSVALETDLQSAQERIRALQRELTEARAVRSGITFAGAKVAADGILSSLGLDALRDDRLERGKRRQRAAGADVDARLEAGQAKRDGGVRGRVPLRFWFIGGYLALLHVCLMLQFTHHRTLPCEPALPGHFAQGRDGLP